LRSSSLLKGRIAHPFQNDFVFFYFCKFVHVCLSLYNFAQPNRPEEEDAIFKKTLTEYQFSYSHANQFEGTLKNNSASCNLQRVANYNNNNNNNSNSNNNKTTTLFALF